MVDKKQDPYNCEGGLDNTKDAGGEEAGVCACDADAAKDGRAIVIDGVDARA